MVTDWRNLAACLDEDPEAFFPDPTNTPAITYAKAICAGCPVRTECLDDALAIEGGKGINGRDGIRGGMSRTQRRREYEKRNRAGLIAKPTPAAKRAAPNPYGPKLDDKKRAKIRKLFAQGAKQASLARQFGVSVSTVRRVLGLKLPRSQECKPRELAECGTRSQTTKAAA